MKKARIARLPWECHECSAAIFPGEVYHEETKRDRYNPTRFDTKRTCALCIKHAVEAERKPAKSVTADDLDTGHLNQWPEIADAVGRKCGSAFHHGKHWGRCDLCGGFSESPRAVKR